MVFTPSVTITSVLPLLLSRSAISPCKEFKTFVLRFHTNYDFQSIVFRLQYKLASRFFFFFFTVAEGKFTSIPICLCITVRNTLNTCRTIQTLVSKLYFLTLSGNMVTLSGLSILYQTQRLPLFCATTTSLPGTH